MFHVARAPRPPVYFSPCVAGLDALAIGQAEHGACSLQPRSLPQNVLGGKVGPVTKRFQQTARGCCSQRLLPFPSAARLGSAACGMKRCPGLLQLTRGCRRRARFHSSNPTDLDLAAVLIRGRAFFPEGLGGRGQSRRASRGQQLQGWWESEEDSSGTRIDRTSLLDLNHGWQPPTRGKRSSLLSKEPSEHTRSLIFQNKFSKGSSPSAKTL